MRAVLAIAAITIRTAVRSKIVICLMTLLLGLIVGLPLTVKSDGTIQGHVQIVVNYTLGIAGALLAMSTLWAGCAAVASEIHEKQIQMLVVKPVRRGEIWLGKWTGLMALNAVLLFASLAATYGLLRWSTQPARLPETDRQTLVSDVLVARREVFPPQPDVEAEARARFESDRKAGTLPRDMDEAAAMDALRKNYLAIAGAVPPGAARSWRLALPWALSDDGEITLRYRFASSSIERNPVACLWFAGTTAAPDALRMARTNAPMAFHELKIPARVARGGTELVVTCANVDPAGATLMFADADSVSALIPAGGFLPNLARGALIVLAQLAFLAAMGVTAGTMFSMPVAGFMSVCVLVLLLSAGQLGDLSAQKQIIGPARDPAAWHRVANATLHVLYTSLEVVTKPLQFDSPWNEVATARYIPWPRVAKAALVNALAYGGLLALLGTYVFNRREVALPQNG